MKRDPKRIEPLMRRLTAVWKQNPGLRLGQLINNATNGKDIYYIEDEPLINELQLYSAGYIVK